MGTTEPPLSVSFLDKTEGNTRGIWYVGLSYTCHSVSSKRRGRPCPDCPHSQMLAPDSPQGVLGESCPCPYSLGGELGVCPGPGDLEQQSCVGESRGQARAPQPLWGLALLARQAPEPAGPAASTPFHIHVVSTASVCVGRGHGAAALWALWPGDTC